MTSRRSFVMAALAVALFAGCDEGEAPSRCPTCGMPVEATSRFRVTGEDADKDVVFDSPKCALRWAGGGATSRAKSLKLTEYYSQVLTPIGELSFVTGSDVMSPMGHDLIPVRGRAAATSFAKDHGGRVLTAAQIDEALLRALDQR